MHNRRMSSNFEESQHRSADTHLPLSGEDTSAVKLDRCYFTKLTLFSSITVVGSDVSASELKDKVVNNTTGNTTW